MEELPVHASQIQIMSKMRCGCIHLTLTQDISAVESLIFTHQKVFFSSF